MEARLSFTLLEALRAGARAVDPHNLIRSHYSVLVHLERQELKTESLELRTCHVRKMERCRTEASGSMTIAVRVKIYRERVRGRDLKSLHSLFCALRETETE